MLIGAPVNYYSDTRLVNALRLLGAVGIVQVVPFFASDVFGLLFSLFIRDPLVVIVPDWVSFDVDGLVYFIFILKLIFPLKSVFPDSNLNLQPIN